MINECNLCNHTDTLSGKDKMLFENDDFYIVDNGNTHLEINDKIQFAKKRISLIWSKHKQRLTASENDRAELALHGFVQKNFGLECDRDYFVKQTMGTYPQHYHLHAYILPFKDEGEVIS